MTFPLSRGARDQEEQRPLIDTAPDPQSVRAAFATRSASEEAAFLPGCPTSVKRFLSVFLTELNRLGLRVKDPDQTISIPRSAGRRIVPMGAIRGENQG